MTDNILTQYNLACRFLAGSYLFGLQTPQSDMDYRAFSRDIIHQPIILLSHDTDYQIRGMNELLGGLENGEIDFVSLLFSPKIWLDDDMTSLQEIITSREQFVTQRKKLVIASILREVHKKLDRIINPSEEMLRKYNKRESFCQFGYDVKESMHAYRLLDLAIRWSNSGYSDFYNSLTYLKDEREKLYEIKRGEWTKDFCLDNLKDKYKTVSRLG